MSSRSQLFDKKINCEKKVWNSSICLREIFAAYLTFGLRQGWHHHGWSDEVISLKFSNLLVS